MSQPTPQELIDIQDYISMKEPTLWHKRETVRLYILETKGHSVRVLDEGSDLLEMAFITARKYFTVQ